jgi:hypothetical protein
MIRRLPRLAESTVPAGHEAVQQGVQEQDTGRQDAEERGGVLGHEGGAGNGQKAKQRQAGGRAQKSARAPFSVEVWVVSAGHEVPPSIERLRARRSLR